MQKITFQKDLNTIQLVFLRWEELGTTIDNKTLLYICETGDEKQALRNRLFERWFSTYERKAQYTFVASSLKDDEGVENYAAIIVRNDNPELSAIIAEFTETISLLSTKP